MSGPRRPGRSGAGHPRGSARTETGLATFDRATDAGWTFHDLTATLGAHGIEVGKSHGGKVVRALDVPQAITHRDPQDIPESDEDTGP